MKINLRSTAILLILVILCAALLVACSNPSEGGVTTVDPSLLSPEPTEIGIEWEKGYVGSFENIGDGRDPKQLAGSGAFVSADGYVTSKPILITGKTTLTFEITADMSQEKVFVISHWEKNGDDTYTLDVKAPHIRACDLIVKEEGGVYKYSYTTGEGTQLLRISVRSDSEITVMAANDNASPTLSAFEGAYTLPASGEGSVTDIALNKGSVGSINNISGYKLAMNYADSAFLTTQNILIPTRGTTIKYTVTGEYSAEVAALTSWYAAESGFYENDSGAPNFNALTGGKGDVQTSTGKAQHSFEYMTSVDNEVIRLCVPAENTSLTVEYSVSERFFKGTRDDVYVYNIGMETISDIVWQPGYASSPLASASERGLITVNSLPEGTTLSSSDVFESYIISSPIRVAKKGTKLVIAVNAPARKDIAVLSSYESDGVTIDYTKATFIGNPEAGNAYFENYIDKKNISVYTYVTSEDNECIRFTIPKGRTSYVPIIGITETGSTSNGTWDRVNNYHASQFDTKLVNMKGNEISNLTPLNVMWDRGYVTNSGFLQKSATGYIQSELIHLEKKGSVLYFKVSSAVGSDGNTYIGTEGCAFSIWDGNPNSLSAKSVVKMQDLDTYLTPDGKFRVYRYTSREDNEYVKLSMRYTGNVQNVPAMGIPVFVADNSVAISTGESEIKVKADGKEYTCKIKLPEGYTPDNYYGLLLTDNEGAYNTACGAAPAETVCVYANADSDKALYEIYSYISALFPINGERTYYVGSRTVLSQYTAGELSADKLTKDNTAVLVSLQNDKNYYASILNGITMHAIGDSYFQGSGLGNYNTWPSMLARKYNMTHVNYGIGGSTIANVSTNNPMVVRYTSMASGPADIIILEGGRNDRNNGVPYGSFDSKDVNTLCGAMNVMIEGLHKKYPNALIILVTPWNYKDTSGGVTYEYAKKMVEYEAQLGLDYVTIINAADTSVSGVDMNNKSFRERYSKASGDVSHLNSEGMANVFKRFEPIVAKYYAEFKGLQIDANGALVK